MGNRQKGLCCVKSILLLKHALLQRVIAAKHVVFTAIYATWWRLPPLRQQGSFKVNLLYGAADGSGSLS